MCTRGRERGFTLVELLTVVGIMGVLLAVSIPNIMEWLKLYRLRAAAQEVTGELQSARMQAVMKNTRLGVTLYIVDSNSYRWVNLDLATPGPLRDLPPDIVFDVASQVPVLAGAPTTGLRFSRLGAACAEGVGDCAVTVPICPEPRCNDNNSTVGWMASTGPVTGVGLLNQRNGLTRTLSIGLGGRVEGQ